ncbi:hypothetical protein C8T65DRAFT_680452 [Cerioporus squamosus]|nr:hypothetical protein C8T65DRAFT_680452 [Cerioporus squamosus]
MYLTCELPTLRRASSVAPVHCSYLPTIAISPGSRQAHMYRLRRVIWTHSQAQCGRRG